LEILAALKRGEGEAKRRRTKKQRRQKKKKLNKLLVVRAVCGTLEICGWGCVARSSMPQVASFLFANVNNI